MRRHRADGLHGADQFAADADAHPGRRVRACRRCYNVIISNVPGPRGKLYFLGAEMEAYYPISALAHGQALNITVMSYAGGLYFGFTGVPRPRAALQRLAVYTGEALDELERTFMPKASRPSARRRRARPRREPGRASALRRRRLPPSRRMTAAGMDQARGAAPERVEVAIVGAGFGGLCLGIKLLEAGTRDFVILEKDDEVGGTWRDNTYPGAECDVQSHLYSYSFERQARLEPALRGLAGDPAATSSTPPSKYGLRPYIRFGQRVCGAHFDAATGRWTVNLQSGPTLSARHFVLATGPLHVPQIPRIPGLERFRGKVFHSARWDHGYDLAGKRVASIGTGGSAIQYCPEIAPRGAAAARLPAHGRMGDPARHASLPRGRQAALRALPVAGAGCTVRGCTGRTSRACGRSSTPSLSSLFEALRAGSRCAGRSGTRSCAQRLTPDYRIGCKRVLVSNAWYPMFNRPNVELVTDGIREVTRAGHRHRRRRRARGRLHHPRHRLHRRPAHLHARLPGHGPAGPCAGRRLAGRRRGVLRHLGARVTRTSTSWSARTPALGHNSIIFMIEAPGALRAAVPARAAPARRGLPRRRRGRAAAFQRARAAGAARARCGARAARAGTSRPTAATSPSGRGRRGATGSRRARCGPSVTASRAPASP